MTGSVNVHIRPSTLGDVGAITEIYAYYVDHTGYTFDITPPAAAEISERRDSTIAGGLPHVVAELDGRVVGFAYASPYRPRPAYRLTLEDAVYVQHDFLRRGIGTRLLQQLLDHCADGPWQQMITVIGDSENLASIRLHTRLGFRHIGVLTGVGQKFGRAFDIVLMQRPVHPEQESRLFPQEVA